MSLLETCASVAIISAVVFFAAPSLIRARENYQLDLTARQVAGKMAWTRIKAISRSGDCRSAISQTRQRGARRNDYNLGSPNEFQAGGGQFYRSHQSRMM